MTRESEKPEKPREHVAEPTSRRYRRWVEIHLGQMRLPSFEEKPKPRMKKAPEASADA